MPKTSLTAFLIALAPSSTTSTPWSTSRPRPVTFESSVVATVAFSVEPSHRPSGLDGVGVDSERDDAAAALELDAVEHHHREAQIAQRPRHEINQVLPRARDELAADRRLRRRTRDLVDVAPDRLTGPRVAARGDAGQHPLEHHVGEPVTRREVRIGVQLDLALAVGGPGARPADRHPAAPERDRAALVTVADRGAVAIVSALRADDLVDLGFHDLVQHAQADADAQGQQPFLRRAGQLTQRVVDPLRHRSMRSAPTTSSAT